MLTLTLGLCSPKVTSRMPRPSSPATPHVVIPILGATSSKRCSSASIFRVGNATRAVARTCSLFGLLHLVEVARASGAINATATAIISQTFIYGPPDATSHRRGGDFMVEVASVSNRSIPVIRSRSAAATQMGWLAAVASFLFVIPDLIRDPALAHPLPSISGGTPDQVRGDDKRNVRNRSKPDMIDGQKKWGGPKTAPSFFVRSVRIRT